MNERPLGLEDLTDLEMSWPTNTDTLIPRAGKRGLVAPMQTNWGGEYARIDGFRAAADLLSERLMTSDRLDENLLYPFASLWRHHIELQLKVLLPDVERLLGRPPSNPAVYEHSLTKLWSALEPLIADSLPDDAADRRNVGRVIQQLAMLDPDGQHFRYARQKNGKRTLPNFRGIDASGFHQALMNVSSYLDATLNAAGYLVAEIESSIDE